MRIRTTLLLLLLVCGLGAFIMLWERDQRSSAQRMPGGKILELNVREIESLEIKNAGGVAKLKLKPDGQWFLTEPFDDRADADFVRAVLALAGEGAITDFVTNAVASDEERKRYGLDDASAIQIAFRKEGKTVGRLKLGKVGALGETVYAESPGNDKIREICLMLARPNSKLPNLRDVLTRPPEEMRDPWLLPMRLERLTRFSIRPGEGKGEIEIDRRILNDKEATPWTLTKPLKTAGNQKEIDEFAGLFCSTRVLSLLPAGQPPGAGFDKPAAELTFWITPEGKGTTVRMFKDPAPDAKTLTAYVTDRKAWCKLDAEFLQAVPSSPNLLRNQTLAQLDPSKISTVLIQSASGAPIHLHRVRGLWIMEEDAGQFFRASGDRVLRLISDLNKAQIGDFVTDSLTNPSLYGLQQPMVTATFATGEHQDIDHLTPVTPANSVTLQFGQGPDQRLYAGFKGEPSVYLMLPDQFNLIPTRRLDFRDLQLLNFTRRQARRIKFTEGALPPVELTSASQSFEWTAIRAATDVTSLIDREAVDSIVVQLGSLRAAEWVEGLQKAHEALQNPALEIGIDVEYQENPQDAPKLKTIALAFAPSGDPKSALYYFGRCTGHDNFFFIKRDLFRLLTAPVLARPK